MVATMPEILTIAGSDSGGGAGVQADIKAISANGGYALSVITSVTAQNTRAVALAHDLPPDVVRAQMDAIFADFDIAATKTGMLASSAIVEAVADALAFHGARNVVVDPVMVSHSGFPLLRRDALAILVERLFPLAAVVTPNATEAELLAGTRVHTVQDAREAARRIAGLGCGAVVVKGGHLRESDATDVLYDGAEFLLIPGERLTQQSTHGAGCTYSAALATFLGRGCSLAEAAIAAKEYVTGAIRHAPRIGHGRGPTHHFWRFST
jgi:hydroxymethylpyrimidine/phosphomethylpyrimidine kinase